MYNRKWGQDRRRFQRLSLNLIVWYKALRPENLCRMLGSSDLAAVTLDISPFGMAFISKHNIPTYSDIGLKFIVFDSQLNPYESLAVPIEVNAKVRSCMPYEEEGYRVGVSFSNIDLEKQQKLAHLMRECLRPIIPIPLH
ncbi:MAG: PilZ domain-containing protein [Candidatus Omnitrophica bacterium]|nr:PilZ domain-containing protein [Candidatus Omnitrophota bacterium]